MVFHEKEFIIDTPEDDNPDQVDPKNCNEVGKGNSRALAHLEVTIAANIRKERLLLQESR